MIAQEHFDVVVVRDPSASVGINEKLARDLAHLAGVSAADVELALHHGRFVVHRAMPGSKVRDATRHLASLGAKFEVRPSAESIDIPAIEPDDEARGGAIGRFDGPLPGFGSSPHESEAKMDSVDLPPPPTRAMPAADPDLTPLPTAEQQGLLDIVDQLEAATGGEVSVMTIDGVDNDTFSAIEAKRDLEVDPIEQVRRETARMTPPREEPLSLDVAATSSPSMEAPVASRSVASAPVASASSGPAYAQPRGPTPEQALRPESGLFFEDMVSNYLAGVAAALVVSLLVAFAVTRSSKREAIVTLEEEISVSYLKPVEVDRGDLRAPEEIERDLEDLYSAAWRQFLLILLVGVPVGLGVGRIRR